MPRRLICHALAATLLLLARPGTAGEASTRENPVPSLFSFGGVLRERFEYFSEPFFGLRGTEQDQYLLHRLLLHADFRPSEYFSAYLEVGNHLTAGKRADRGPTDVDEFDIQQAYATFTLPFDARSSLQLRVGRQELNLGSARLVSVRDGANIRRSFDGGRLTFTAGPATVDALAVRSVNLKVGALNDDSNRHEALWGLYSVLPFPWLPDGHSDVYYLGLERDDASFNQGLDNELRHSFGLRFWGKPGAWDYNVEGVYQTGSFGQADIRAWTVATDFGYTFKSLPFQPRLGLKVDLASGDDNPADGRLETFNALFPKQPYFSEASLIAPANLIDLHPSLDLTLSEQLVFTADWNVFWKHRSEDAIYAPPGRPLVRSGQSDSKNVGQQINFELAWQVRPEVSWNVYYSHFFAGDAVTEAGGRDVDFLGSWLAIEF